jgi:hypothetical protein
MSRNTGKKSSKSFSHPCKMFFLYNVAQQKGYSKIIFILRFYGDK